VVEDSDPRVREEVAEHAGLWLRKGIFATRARVQSLQTHCVACPIVAAAPVQVRVSIPIQIHAVGVPAVTGRQSIRVDSRNDPETDAGGYLIGMSHEMGKKLLS
jgi:hypothetical protein